MLINELKELLNIALNSVEEKRVNAIKKFQKLVWDDTSIMDENLNDMLTDMAYIFDFYEPNIEWRKESSNFYGEERLIELIMTNIKKLEKYIEDIN